MNMEQLQHLQQSLNDLRAAWRNHTLADYQVGTPVVVGVGTGLDIVYYIGLVKEVDNSSKHIGRVLVEFTDRDNLWVYVNGRTLAPLNLTPLGLVVEATHQLEDQRETINRFHTYLEKDTMKLEASIKQANPAVYDTGYRIQLGMAQSYLRTFLRFFKLGK